MKKATVLKKTKVYSKRDVHSDTLKVLQANEEIEVRKEKRRGYLNWYETKLEDGTAGYVLSNYIHIWTLVKIDQEETSFILKGEDGGYVEIPLMKKDKVHIISPHGSKPDMVTVKDRKGRIGDMPEATKTDEVKDGWMVVLTWVLLIAFIAIALVAMIGAGFIVFGPLVILLLMIPVIILLVLTQLFVSMIQGTVRAISIRI